MYQIVQTCLMHGLCWYISCDSVRSRRRNINVCELMTWKVPPAEPGMGIMAPGAVAAAGQEFSWSNKTGFEFMRSKQFIITIFVEHIILAFVQLCQCPCFRPVRPCFVPGFPHFIPGSSFLSLAAPVLSLAVPILSRSNIFF